MYNDFKLLVDGKCAFNEILSCIDNANRTIIINMFIWRDDEIGNLIGKHLLDAANRGVKIYIYIDRYGYVLEKAEEYKKSFFHRDLSFFEKMKVRIVELLYPELGIKDILVKDDSKLANTLINHDNVLVSRNIIKKDHSKYYIFDDEILILGGINIEEKERSNDLSGRIYHDYMVKLSGKKYVNVFHEKYDKGINIDDEFFFGINYKSKHKKIFEMKKLYLDLINNAQKSLYIIMPYFSPIKEIVNALINAVNRGVDIHIMLPKSANLQNTTNYATMRKLMKLTNNKVKVYLSPKMTHAKLIMSDNVITFGSTNINTTSFKTLQELNLFVNNVDCDFINDINTAIIDNFSIADRVNTYKELKYSKFIRLIESFIS